MRPLREEIALVDEKVSKLVTRALLSDRLTYRYIGALMTDGAVEG